MVRIPAVNLRRKNPIRYLDGDGQVRELPQLRLRVSIRVGKPQAADASNAGHLLPAILDTGAPIAVPRG